MTHFGMALGAITATVIGGALLLDHTIKPSERTASQSPPAAVTASETSPPATLAGANGGRESEVMVADARTSVDEASSRSAGKARPPAKAIAGKSNASPSNGGADLRSAPSTTVNTDTQNSADPAPSTSTPSPSTNPTTPDKTSEDQPPSKGPDA